MDQFFEFESDFAESLRCIPMQVRLKLDSCGIKLKLPQWNQLSPGDRAQLMAQPCETTAEIAAYRHTLQQRVLQQSQESVAELPIDPAPPWLDLTTIPASVQAKATEVNATISLPQWRSLTPLQRFALIKLSRSSHENRNFLPALKEFHLA